MRDLLLRLFIPLSCALGLAFFLWEAKPFAENIRASSLDTDPSDLRYISAYHGDPELEDQFLAQPGDSTTIYLLGSSELTSGGTYLPYHFISDRFPIKVMGIGHEGNQCFSIFCQMLAYSDRLKNAPVVIILSPGWFEDKSSQGTSSAVLLEYLSDRLLNRIVQLPHNSEFQHYAYEGISRYAPEFSSPSAAFRLANTAHRSSVSPIHSAVVGPLNAWNSFCRNLKKSTGNERESTQQNSRTFTFPSSSFSIPWDSIETALIEKHRQAAGNNSMGIEAEYYSNYINGKRARVRPVTFSYNREWRDFLSLLKLLEESNSNASFVISPLHAGYYTNLPDLQPVIDSLRSEIGKSGFPCLDLFQSDSTKYRKHLLSDVMHFSEAGWLQVNRFIIDTYGLQKHEN